MDGIGSKVELRVRSGRPRAMEVRGGASGGVEHTGGAKNGKRR
jgi:hypothetical protein